MTVDPEFTTLTCDPSDFLVLVCDGISEGSFPNHEVIALAAAELRAGGGGEKRGQPDPGAAAAAVCRRALEMNSKDNLSCMVVLLGGGDLEGLECEFLSGPFTKPREGGFRRAYEAMAAHAGLTLVQAVERRYDDARRERAEAIVRASDKRNGDVEAEGDKRNGDVEAEEENGRVIDGMGELREEISLFGDGPPGELTGSSRTQWFEKWLDGHDVQPELSIQEIQALMSKPPNEVREEIRTRPDLRAMAEAHGYVQQEVVRRVRLPSVAVVRKAFSEAHLPFDPRLEQIGDQLAEVMEDDESDGTSKVRVGNLQAWLPTTLVPRLPVREVQVVPLTALREAIEAHPGLKWANEYEKVAGKRGKVLRDDPSDDTCQVEVTSVLIAWFPSSVLVDLKPPGDGDSTTASEGEPEAEPTTDTATASEAESEAERLAKRSRTD